jgi:hypothetical protein
VVSFSPGFGSIFSGLAPVTSWQAVVFFWAVKTHNGWNRERDVKEMYENFIQIVKGKLEETTPKRKQKDSRKWRTRKNRK